MVGMEVELFRDSSINQTISGRLRIQYAKHIVAEPIMIENSESSLEQTNLTHKIAPHRIRGRGFCTNWCGTA